MKTRNAEKETGRGELQIAQTNKRSVFAILFYYHLCFFEKLAEFRSFFPSTFAFELG